MKSIWSGAHGLLLAVGCSVLFCAGLPASAQTTSIATPAEKYAVNPAGVDMRTGAYIYHHTDLSIGGEGESGGLSLTRTNMNPWHNNQPLGNFTHQWDIMLTLKKVDIENGNYQNLSGGDYQVSVHYGGRSKTFNSPLIDTGFVEASQSEFASLTYTGSRDTGTYTFTAADGTIATFRPLSNSDCNGSGFACAVISQITETDGTTFNFNYAYDASQTTADKARLSSIVSSRGYGMVLEANPATGNLITKACVLNLTTMAMPTNGLCPANAQATVTYTYISFNGTRLASVTDPSGAVWGFTYAGSAGAFTMGYVKPGQSTPWLTNSLETAVDEDDGGYEAVFSQSFADGQHFSYLWDHTPVVISRVPDSTIVGGQYSDATGATTVVRYDFPAVPGSNQCKAFDTCPPLNFGDGKTVYQTTSGPTTIVDANSNTSTSDYCDPNEAALTFPDGGCLVTLLQSFTDPEGAKTVLTYDMNRNIASVTRHAKPGSGLADIVTSATYDVTHAASSNKPLTTTDALGHTTTYSYDPVHGGITSETDPAVNGVTPQKRYTYAQRYAWISNGAGGYVRAATPVWVLTQMSTCKTGNPSGTGCALAGDEVITTYDYGPDGGPNNLNLRGTVVDAGGLSLRTCIAFDALGNKISETRPRAGLASCP